MCEKCQAKIDDILLESKTDDILLEYLEPTDKLLRSKSYRPRISDNIYYMSMDGIYSLRDKISARDKFVSEMEAFKVIIECQCEKLDFPNHNHLVHYGGCKECGEFSTPGLGTDIYICLDCAIDSMEKNPPYHHSFYSSIGIRLELNELLRIRKIRMEAL